MSPSPRPFPTCYTVGVLPARPGFFFPLALIFLAAHLAALRFHLYWYLPWYDMAMHTAGGFLTIMGFIMFRSLGSRRLGLADWLLPWGLLLVMVAWEVFEYVYGVAGSHPSYAVDTAIDLLCGATGGLLAYLTVRRS